MDRIVCVLLITVIAASICGAESKVNDGRFEATLKSCVIGKGHFRFHEIDMTYRNPADRPTWVLLPFASLESGVGEKFTICASNIHFSANEHTRNDRRAIEVNIIGEPAVTAIFVPPHGTVNILGYILFARVKHSKLMVWEAESLWVDGKSPLERWLPFSPLCEPDSTIWSNAIFDVKRLKVDPQEYGAREIEFTGLESWSVPLREPDPEKTSACADSK